MSIDQHSLQQILRSVGQQELLPRFAQVDSSFKQDGSIVTEVDLAAQKILTGELQALYPGSLVLGEEMPESEQRQLLSSGEPLWCLDPLDGTTNFVAGIPYFSISVALLEQGKVTLGAVYDPVRDELFHADRSSAAMLNGESLAEIRARQMREPISLRQSIALIDFKRLPPELSRRMSASPPYKSQRSFGSVALDWCWLAAARVHVYLHGRANLWDYVAGHFIFEQGGGCSCTLQGKPIFKAELDARSCVAAANEDLFNEWVSCLEMPAIT